MLSLLKKGFKFVPLQKCLIFRDHHSFPKKTLARHLMMVGRITISLHTDPSRLGINATIFSCRTYGRISDAVTAPGEAREHIRRKHP